MRLWWFGAETRLRGSALVVPVLAGLAMVFAALVAEAGKEDNSLIVGAPIDFTDPDPANGTLGTDMQSPQRDTVGSRPTSCCSTARRRGSTGPPSSAAPAARS